MTDKEKKCEHPVTIGGRCETCDEECPPPQESEENWETQFRNKFFVYKLGGKHPDHVGAEKEAIAFIADLVVKNFDQGYQKGKMESVKIVEECIKSNVEYPPVNDIEGIAINQILFKVRGLLRAKLTE